VQGCDFWGPALLHFDPIFPQIVDFALWALLTILKNFQLKMGLTLEAPRENVPYSKNYTFGSWMLNTQINPLNRTMWMVAPPEVDFPLMLHIIQT